MAGHYPAYELKLIFAILVAVFFLYLLIFWSIQIGTPTGTQCFQLTQISLSQKLHCNAYTDVK